MNLVYFILMFFILEKCVFVSLFSIIIVALWIKSICKATTVQGILWLNPMKWDIWLFVHSNRCRKYQLQTKIESHYSVEL